jgi:hypothetical protein
MSRGLATLMMASVLGLTLGVGYQQVVRGQPRRYVFTALLVLLSAAVYAFAFPNDEIESKGVVEEWLAVAICYVSMVLGMVAQYFYKQAESGRKKLTIETMEFLMPILASPIVFIPLLTITSDMTFSGPLTKTRLMVYLVAFQNGFFWKTFFEQRQRKIANAEPAAATQ